MSAFSALTSRIQPCQNFFRALVWWEDRIPHLDDLAILHRKRQTPDDMPSLPLKRRQTQRLDKCKLLVRQQLVR